MRRENMKKIADYDTINYDYSTYWKRREYEHLAEVLALKKLLKDSSDNWFLDIGGSYGRLLPTYYDNYNNPVIIDYSLKTLQKNYSNIKRDFPNTYLIAANAYHLPFKDNSFNGALTVRVLHHIVKPDNYFKEIYRVLEGDSIYIQEFANKLHIKAVIKSLFSLNFSLFKPGPYQQPDKGHHEGSRKHVKVPFYNYDVKWIRENLKQVGFVVKKKLGCSFLRLNLFKRIFSLKQLLFFEKLSQNLLSFTNIAPSIFLKLLVRKESSKKHIKKLEDILVCPKCKDSLNFTKNKATCSSCREEFLKKDNIWDFRV